MGLSLCTSGVPRRLSQAWVGMSGVPSRIFCACEFLLGPEHSLTPLMENWHDLLDSFSGASCFGAGAGCFVVKIEGALILSWPHLPTRPRDQCSGSGYSSWRRPPTRGVPRLNWAEFLPRASQKVRRPPARRPSPQPTPRRRRFAPGEACRARGDVIECI